MHLRFLTLLAVAVALWSPQVLPAVAQEAEPASAAIAPADEAEDTLLTEAELDELVAPIALYPDSLLAQVLVAATYPLDVVKADRWVKASAEMPDAERSAKAEEQSWDPSIQVLAAGFPTVVTKMADNLDWTEAVGNALILQSDDVLDAIQRQRARAAAVGSLTSNEAQVVEVSDQYISIAPANPEVVYVPAYDPAIVYTQAPPGSAVIWDDADYYDGSLLATGIVAFGAGLLIHEIFDDNDDWGNYWRPGYPPVNWGNGAIYPRPGIGIGGDVNIDRGDINIDRENNINIDRTRIGSVDRDNIDIDRGGAWKPTERDREKARENVRENAGNRQRPETLPARGDGSGLAAAGGALAGGAAVAGGAALANRAGGATGADAARDKIRARAGDGSVPSLARPAAGAAAKPRPAVRDSSLTPGDRSPARAAKAGDRGKTSRASLPQAAARPKAAAKPKSVSRPTTARAPTRKAAPKSSAINRNSSASRAKASSARGSRSAGGGGRRR